ncbi:MAG: GAF domain-containing protein [Bryobacteraceae bacterium]
MAKTKDLESRLERLERQLRLYQTISRLLVKQSPLAESVETVMRLLAEFAGSDSCLLYLVSAGELILCASAGPNPQAVGEVRLRLDEGLTGWVARERRLLAISREAYNDPRFKFFRDLPEDTFEAFLSGPIIIRNRVVGVINIQHRQPHSHSGDEMELLHTVGEQLGALVALACLDSADFDRAAYADLVLSSRLAVGSR